MKKILLPLLVGAAAMALTGCQKKGAVSGVVLDPFTNKPVEMPTVWMDSTIYSTYKDTYVYKDSLRVGRFRFEQVPTGSYLLKARRVQYVLGTTKVTTTDKKPNVEVTLYEYSNQLEPGLYKGSEAGPVKISNDWVIFNGSCKESAGYRKSYTQDMNASKVPDEKSKAPKELKTSVLPAPLVVSANIDVFYCNASSVTTPIEAYTYPAVTAQVSSHPDCTGFGTDKEGVFANTDKGTKLDVAYVAEGLFRVTGNLPKGKQIIRLVQEGKTLQTYYFEVK